MLATDGIEMEIEMEARLETTAEPMDRWAATELQTLDLGDTRRNRRLVRMVEDLAAQPTASIPQACGAWPATKGCYRFWDTPAVTPAAIRAAHRDATCARLDGQETVLALQDTTDVYCVCPPDRVHLHVHSVLAVSTAGVPLGFLHQHTWQRDPTKTGTAKTRRKRATREKESQRWLTAQEATEAVLPADTTVITIADREADIYDFFALPRRDGAELLIRATHNRRVEQPEAYLWWAIEQTPPAGRYTVEVGRTPTRLPRTATLTVRFATVRLLVPRHQKQRSQCRPISVQVILAQEEAPPAGVAPICWLLLTTLPVHAFDDAVQCVRYYSFRWLIERYHFVLKSGCGIEQRQLETTERIEREVATYSIVAWRLLWLTYEARRDPAQPCTVALSQTEWQALVCHGDRTAIPPAEPPSLREAVRRIAQLGGFLGRRHDGEPGVKTIWRGLQRLHDIADTWALMHPPDHEPEREPGQVQLDRLLMGKG